MSHYGFVLTWIFQPKDFGVQEHEKPYEKLQEYSVFELIGAPKWNILSELGILFVILEQQDFVDYVSKQKKDERKDVHDRHPT